MITIEDLYTKYGFKKIDSNPNDPMFSHLSSTDLYYEDIFHVHYIPLMCIFKYKGIEVSKSEFFNKVDNHFNGAELINYPSYNELLKKYREIDDLKKRMDADLF